MGQDQIYKYEPLWGSWYIDSLIGEGSFGSVYKVYREELGRKYFAAVKIISVPSKEQYREAQHTLGRDESTLKMYFQDLVKSVVDEIGVLYSLSGNSNIINYQDHKVIERDDSLGWDILIRMEYVTSLRDYLDNHSMTREDIIRLGIDMCSALEICQRQNIIHRDIKDENIFVNEYGVHKLGDFGIARELSKTGRAASMRGTPLYMAPEIYRGEKYDSTVDIYSLGIVLYKLLNHGRLPFMPSFPEVIRFKDSEEALEKRLSGETLPVPDQSGELLGNEILKACNYQSKDRFQSANEFRLALESVLRRLTNSQLAEPITLMDAFKDVDVTTKNKQQRNDLGISYTSDELQRTESIAFPHNRTESAIGTSAIQSADENKAKPDTISYLKKHRKPILLSLSVLVLLISVFLIVSFINGANNTSLSFGKGNEEDKNSNSETSTIQAITSVTSIASTTSERLPAATIRQGPIVIGFAVSSFEDKWLAYLREGAESKARELGVELIMVDGRDDSAFQLSQVENFVAQGIDAVVVVAVNTNATEAMTKACFDAGIPLIAVNRPFNNADDMSALVMSNNVEAGTLQMQYMGSKLNGEGNIVILKGSEGHEAAQLRTEGNLKVIKEEYPDIKVLEINSANWDRAQGKELAEACIQRYGQELDAFICNNDEMAIGAITAIENAGLTSKILTAGVDGTPDALVELKKGTLSFTVFQDPAGQGAGGVQAAYDIVSGKIVEKNVWIPYKPVPPEKYNTYAAFWGMR